MGIDRIWMSWNNYCPQLGGLGRQSMPSAWVFFSYKELALSEVSNNGIGFGWGFGLRQKGNALSGLGICPDLTNGLEIRMVSISYHQKCGASIKKWQKIWH